MSSDGDKFAWPPRRSSGVVGERPPAQTSTPEKARGRWAGVLREIEATWLDVTAAPLAERIQEAAWRADMLADFCLRCGMSVGPGEATVDGCRQCRLESVPWERCIRLAVYRSPLSDWVKEVKYTRWRRLASDLGRLLGRQIGAALASAGREAHDVRMVSVPMSWRRRMARGIDHSAVIARSAAKEVGGEFEAILWREHRPAQTSISRSAREANLRGAIHARRIRAGAVPLRIIVDDVMTTGATMRAATRALRESGVTSEIWVAVLGRAEDHAAR